MEDGGEDSSEDGAGRDGGAYGGTSEKILFQRSHKIFSLVEAVKYSVSMGMKPSR